MTPKAVETAETENAEMGAPDEETPEVEAAEAEPAEVEAGLDPSQVDTVELEPVDLVEDEAVEEPEAADADDPAEETPEMVEAGAPADPVTVEETEAVAAETADATETVEPGEEGDDDAEPIAALAPASPYDLPGDWYVIHSYSGYENKVKANLETRIQSMHMEDRIFEVHIPMEDVVEFKAGKKVTVPKKVFPGYILVRMTLDDDSWYAVRNTPGVTGFVAGNAQKPTPLSRREVERFLGVQEEEEKAKPRFKPEWEVGEQVRVVTGPFADFNGVIEDMNVDQQKIVVLVNIFGRDTPVELGFEDIQKN
jgi:transcriptional antiterminator NusG